MSGLAPWMSLLSLSCVQENVQNSKINDSYLRDDKTTNLFLTTYIDFYNAAGAISRCYRITFDTDLIKVDARYLSNTR